MKEEARKETRQDFRLAKSMALGQTRGDNGLEGDFSSGMRGFKKEINRPTYAKPTSPNGDIMPNLISVSTSSLSLPLLLIKVCHFVQLFGAPFCLLDRMLPSLGITE